MRKLLTFLIALAAVAFAVVSPASPQGFNGGGFNIGNGPFASGGAYTGPGDIVSGTVAAWSCSRAYKASFANGTNSLCDLVAVTGGAAVCTLRVAPSVFVGLTAYFPGSLTPSAAC